MSVLGHRKVQAQQVKWMLLSLPVCLSIFHSPPSPHDLRRRVNLFHLLESLNLLRPYQNIVKMITEDLNALMAAWQYDL